MLDKVITEKANKFPPKGTFEGVKGKPTKKKKKAPFVGKKTGPEGASGFKPATKAESKFSLSSEKTENKNINNHMSKSFDKIVSDVLNGRLQLENPDIETIDDISAAPESGHEGYGHEGGEGEGEGGELEELTPAEIISKIRDLLDQLDMQEEGEGEEGEHFGAEGEGEEGEHFDNADGGSEDNEEKKGEDEEEVAGEATEMKELPNTKPTSPKGKANVVPGHASKVAGGKAKATVTDEVGNTETGIHPLISPERMNKGMTYPKKNVANGNVKQGRQIGT